MYKPKMTDKEKKADVKKGVWSFATLVVCSICKRIGGTLEGMGDGKENKKSGKNQSKTYRHVRNCPNL